MAINTPHKEEAAVGYRTTTATAISELNFLTVNRSDKARSAFRAAPAWSGRTLHRRDPKDGPVTYCSERWELMHYPPSFDDARWRLEQIGGWL